MRGGLLSAIQFLTIIPIKTARKDHGLVPGALASFPLAGLLIGLAAAAIGYILYLLGFADLLTNVIVVIFLVVITGGIHLDGLSDTFDALASGKGREKMLEIMRDPHAGVMGILSVVSILLLKVSLLSSIAQEMKPTSLVLMCVLSRWALVLSLYKFPYARKEGKAKVFKEGADADRKIFIYATVIALAVSVFTWQFKGVSIFIAAAGLTYLVCRFFNKKFGGITGDTLGATNELAEVSVLFAVLIIERIFP